MKNGILLILILAGLVSCGSNQKLPNDPHKTSPLQAGAQVPSINMKDVNGNDVALENLTSSKNTILVFYRGGWCPYCNVQLKGLKKVLSQVKKHGFQMVAVSPDRPSELAKSTKKLNLPYTLLSDSPLHGAKAFGIAFRVDDKTVEKYKEYKIDLVAASGQSHLSLPIPSVYVIDRSGKIHYAYTNPDYKVRLDHKTLLTQIKKLSKKNK